MLKNGNKLGAPILEECTEKGVISIPAFHFYMDYLIKSQKYYDCEKHLKVFVEKNPKDHISQLLLFNLHLSMNNEDHAVNVAKKIVETDGGIHEVKSYLKLKIDELHLKKSNKAAEIQLPNKTKIEEEQKEESKKLEKTLDNILLPISKVETTKGNDVKIAEEKKQDVPKHENVKAEPVKEDHKIQDAVKPEPKKVEEQLKKEEKGNTEIKKDEIHQAEAKKEEHHITEIKPELKKEEHQTEQKKEEPKNEAKKVEHSAVEAKKRRS